MTYIDYFKINLHRLKVVLDLDLYLVSVKGYVTNDQYSFNIYYEPFKYVYKRLYLDNFLKIFIKRITWDSRNDEMFYNQSDCFEAKDLRNIDSNMKRTVFY